MEAQFLFCINSLLSNHTIPGYTYMCFFVGVVFQWTQWSWIPNEKYFYYLCLFAFQKLQKCIDFWDNYGAYRTYPLAWIWLSFKGFIRCPKGCFHIPGQKGNTMGYENDSVKCEVKYWWKLTIAVKHLKVWPSWVI